MDRLPTRTFFLLDALLEKEPFSDERGSFFMLFRRGFASKMSKIRTKSIYC